jgi:transcription antitermination factor NusG
MKKFLAIYLGTEAAMEKAGWTAMSEKMRKEKQDLGIEAWTKWAAMNQGAIVDIGTPLGKTKRVSARGIEDRRNELTGYVIVQAESHEAAAKLFEAHPHFMIFPGESVEIIECLHLPH